MSLKLFEFVLILFILAASCIGKRLESKSKQEEMQPAIIIDFDESRIIAGFAGEPQPSVIMPAIIGTPIDPDLVSDPEFPGYFVGQEAVSMHDQLNLRFAFDRGIIKDWDALTILLDHLFRVELQVDPKEHKVLISQNLFTPFDEGNRLGAMLFDTFSVPAIQIVPQPVLNIFYTLHFSGVSVEINAGTIYFLVVSEGVAFSDSLRHIEMGYGHIYEYMYNIISERRTIIDTDSERRSIRELLKKYGHVAYDFDDEMRKFAVGASREIEFEMEDGTIIVVGNERIRAPEALFKPFLVGSQEEGIHKQIFNSIAKSGITNTKDIYSNIVLTGKLATLSGLPERLELELQKLSPSASVHVHAIPQSEYPTIIGGSMIIPVFEDFDKWITREQYEEGGVGYIFSNRF